MTVEETMSKSRSFSLTERERLAEIAIIIAFVDNRCAAADGPVTPTLEEMRQSEISEIYALALNDRRFLKGQWKADDAPGPSPIAVVEVPIAAKADR